MYRYIQRPKRIECDLLTCPAFKHPVVNPMSPSEICSLYFTLKVVHNATLKDKNCEWCVCVLYICVCVCVCFNNVCVCVVNMCVCVFYMCVCVCVCVFS